MRYGTAVLFAIKHTAASGKLPGVRTFIQLKRKDGRSAKAVKLCVSSIIGHQIRCME